MKHYILFTKEELCDMLCGKEVEHTISNTGTLYFMCKDYFDTKEEQEEPLDLGYVEFVDGHREDISWCDVQNGILRFRIPSGTYVFQSWVDELDSGHKYRTHCFYDALTGITQRDILTAVLRKPR